MAHTADTSQETAPARRPLRRDAAENQSRIIEAARDVFAAQGVDAPLADVAVAAGVGVATLSRRLTRRQLVEAVLEERLEDHLLRIDESLELAPKEAFVAYVEGLCERRVRDRSLCHALTLDMADSPKMAELRDAIRVRQITLIDAGIEAGVLRADLVPQDLVLTLEAVGGVMEATQGTDAWRRTLATLMNTLLVGHADDPLPPPPTPEQLLETRHGPPRGRRPSSITAEPAAR